MAVVEGFLLDNQRESLTVAFFGTLALVALWEGLQPRRVATQSLKLRWTNNFALALIDLGAMRLVIPVAALTISIAAQERAFGLFHFFELPLWLSALAGLLALDFARWLHHFLLHKVPVLWRFHRVHHADQDYDYTVGIRFHPVEAWFTTIFVFPFILLFGVPPVAIVLSELGVAVTGLIVHANGYTPRWVERYVRPIFVTPDMHRIHHSIDRKEHDSNYAAVFSFWDRLFGTYTAEPADGQTGMTIGLSDLRDQECQKLTWMLLSPFRSMKKREPTKS